MMAVKGLRSGMNESTPVSPRRAASPHLYGGQQLPYDEEDTGEAGSNAAAGPSGSRHTGLSLSQTEEHTLKRIREALDRSADEGDTLDLSRRGIEGIGAEAVVIFDQGVGKDRKGVWRYALVRPCGGHVINDRLQTSAVLQLVTGRVHRWLVLPAGPTTIPEPKRQQLLALPPSGECPTPPVTSCLTENGPHCADSRDS